MFRVKRSSVDTIEFESSEEGFGEEIANTRLQEVGHSIYTNQNEESEKKEKIDQEYLEENFNTRLKIDTKGGEERIKEEEVENKIQQEIDDYGELMRNQRALIQREVEIRSEISDREDIGRAKYVDSKVNIYDMGVSKERERSGMGYSKSLVSVGKSQNRGGVAMSEDNRYPVEIEGSYAMMTPTRRRKAGTEAGGLENGVAESVYRKLTTGSSIKSQSQNVQKLLKDNFDLQIRNNALTEALNQLSNEGVDTLIANFTRAKEANIRANEAIKALRERNGHLAAQLKQTKEWASRQCEMTHGMSEKERRMMEQLRRQVAEKEEILEQKKEELHGREQQVLDLEYEMEQQKKVSEQLTRDVLNERAKADRWQMLAQRADGYKDRRKMSNGSSMFVSSSEYAHPQSYLHVSPKLQNSHGPTTGRLSVAKNAFELNQYRASMSDSTARAGSATVADFQTDFLQLQTTIAKQDAEIAKLNFTIDNLNNSLNTLSFENKALNSNSSALQSLQAENQRLSKLVHSYEATISHLNNSLTSAELLAREQEYSYNRAILAQKQLVHEKDLNLSALSTKIEYLENSASILRKNLLADLRKAKVTQDIQDRVLGLIDICENFKP